MNKKYILMSMFLLGIANVQAIKLGYVGKAVIGALALTAPAAAVNCPANAVACIQVCNYGDSPYEGVHARYTLSDSSGFEIPVKTDKTGIVNPGECVNIEAYLDKVRYEVRLPLSESSFDDTDLCVDLDKMDPYETEAWIGDRYLRGEKVGYVTADTIFGEDNLITGACLTKVKAKAERNTCSKKYTPRAGDLPGRCRDNEATLYPKEKGGCIEGVNFVIVDEVGEHGTKSVMKNAK